MRIAALTAGARSTFAALGAWLTTLSPRSRWIAGGSAAALLVTALVVTLLIGSARSVHEARAQDWLEIGNYDQARQEIALAIQENPKSVSARVLLASTFIKQVQATHERPDLLDRALRVLDEADRIDRTSESDKLRGATYELLSEIAKQGRGVGVLDAVRNHQSPPAAPVLESIIEFSDHQTSLAAEELLFSLDADRARRKLTELLSAPELSVRERSAERLIEREPGNPTAAGIVREKLKRELPQLQNAQQASNYVHRLVELGYDEIADYLVDILRTLQRGQSDNPPALAALAALVERGDARVGEIGRQTIHIQSADEGMSIGCARTSLAVVGALGQLGGAENLEALKETLAYVMPNDSSRFGCRNVYFEALARLDQPAWLQVDNWYDPGGWDILNTMILGRIAEMRSGTNSSAYGARNWALFAPTAAAASARIANLVQRLGKYTPFAGGRLVSFKLQKMTFTNPSTVQLLTFMHDVGRGNAISKEAAGRFTLTLEALAPGSDQPWQITKVEDCVLDGEEIF